MAQQQRDIMAEIIQITMYNMIKDLRATDVTADGIPSERMLKVLSCCVCRNYMTHGPLHVRYDTLSLVCYECVMAMAAEAALNPEAGQAPRTVALHPFIVADIRFPCVYAFFGCPDHHPYGNAWIEHTHVCPCVDNLNPALMDESTDGSEQMSDDEATDDDLETDDSGYCTSPVQSDNTVSSDEE